MGVKLARIVVTSARGDIGLAVTGMNPVDQLRGVIPLIGDDLLDGQVLEQRLGLGDIVHLPSRQEASHRVAAGVDDRVDLGTQATARAPERLGAVFFAAPAPC